MAYITQYSNSVPVIRFNIEQVKTCIGQDIEMDICVPEEGVAQCHAGIRAIKGPTGYRYMVESFDEKTQVTLNEHPVSMAELADGDWLQIGEVEFQFSDDGVDHIKEESPAEKHDASKKEKVASLAEPETVADVFEQEEIKEEPAVARLSTREFIEKNRSRRLRMF